MSRYSRMSKTTHGTRHSEYSKATSNKTYVQHLEKVLLEEKEARLKLETELSELKRLSTEVLS